MCYKSVIQESYLKCASYKSILNECRSKSVLPKRVSYQEVYKSLTLTILIWGLGIQVRVLHFAMCKLNRECYVMFRGTVRETADASGDVMSAGCVRDSAFPLTSLPADICDARFVEVFWRIGLTSSRRVVGALKESCIATFLAPPVRCILPVKHPFGFGLCTTTSTQSISVFKKGVRKKDWAWESATRVSLA